MKYISGRRAVVLDENCILPNCHVCGKEMSIICLDEECVNEMNPKVKDHLIKTGMMKERDEHGEYPCAVCLKCLEFKQK